MSRRAERDGGQSQPGITHPGSAPRSEGRTFRKMAAGPQAQVRNKGFSRSRPPLLACTAVSLVDRTESVAYREPSWAARAGNWPRAHSSHVGLSPGALDFHTADPHGRPVPQQSRSSESFPASALLAWETPRAPAHGCSVHQCLLKAPGTRSEGKECVRVSGCVCQERVS